MLSHSNLVANSAGTSMVLADWIPGDRHICYLPLAHIYERVNLVTCTHCGCSVGFYSGNVQVRHRPGVRGGWFLGAAQDRSEVRLVSRGGTRARGKGRLVLGAGRLLLQCKCCVESIAAMCWCGGRGVGESE